MTQYIAIRTVFALIMPAETERTFNNKSKGIIVVHNWLANNPQCTKIPVNLHAKLWLRIWTATKKVVSVTSKVTHWRIIAVADELFTTLVNW